MGRLCRVFHQMQHHLWKLQPQGIHEFVLSLMSVHDELAVVSREETVLKIVKMLTEKVEEQRKTVFLTCIEWFTGNKSWAEKGGKKGPDGKVKGTMIGWTIDEETE